MTKTLPTFKAIDAKGTVIARGDRAFCEGVAKLPKANHPVTVVAISPATLANDSLIKVEGKTHRRIRVGTARGYAAKYWEDAEVSHQKALANGHETAWTNLEAAVLHDGSPEMKAKEQEQFEKDMSGAIVVKTGDEVMIEGEMFRVVVVGVQYADPIHFVRV